MTRIQFISGRPDSCSWWSDLIGEDCYLGLLVITECIKKNASGIVWQWFRVVIWTENCHKSKVWSLRYTFSLDSLYTSLNCFRSFFWLCLCCPHLNTGASWSSCPSAHLFSFYVLLLDTFFSLPGLMQISLLHSKTTHPSSVCFYIELILVKGVRSMSRFIFWACGYPVVPVPFVEKTVFAPLSSVVSNSLWPYGLWPC